MRRFAVSRYNMLQQHGLRSYTKQAKLADLEVKDHIRSRRLKYGAQTVTTSFRRPGGIGVPESFRRLALAGQQNLIRPFHGGRRKRRRTRAVEWDKTTGTEVGSSEGLEMRTQDNVQIAETHTGVARYDKAQIGLCYFDTDLRYVEINDWLAALNGLPPAEHVGRTIDEILPGVAASVMSQLRQVFETGEPILEGLAYAETAAHPGTKRFYGHNYYPDKSADGTVVGVKCIVQDITQQRLVDVKGIIPWEADAQTWEFSYVGPQAEEMLGYPVERWYERGFWTSCIHPDDQESAIDFCSTSSRSRQHFEFEYRMIKADGEIVWIRDIVGVECVQGEPIILRGFMFDISELKNAKEHVEEGEQALRSALEEVNKLRQRLEDENVYLRGEIRREGRGDELVGDSSRMRQVSSLVSQVAPTDATVLILGETGTGKELVARSIHALSRRRDQALIKVNCTTLPSTLIESELFGHVKGAYTGAVRQRVGRFELADGGTIFLDEIGDLPIELQPKLLRVLQDGEFERLGSTETMKVDVRVIAATNSDIESAVADGRFRKDLYYRLQVFPMYVPPLRERTSDIPLLVWYFLGRTKVSIGRPIESVPDDVMQRLVQYSWPGNVRELENVIERSVILTDGTSLYLEPSFGDVDVRHATPPDTIDVRSTRLADVERAHIVSVLEECGWRVKGKSKAAERLGIHPSTLLHRLKKLGIKRPATPD